MAEPITPVEIPEIPKEEPQTVPPAGTEQPETPPSEPKGDEKGSIDSQAIVDLLEANDKALESAEKKIVSLKRKLRGAGVDEYGDDGQDDVLSKIETLEQEVAALKGAKDQGDADLQTARANAREMAESLKAKAATSKVSRGANQDRFVPEEDLTKRYSPADLSILQRVADRKSMKLNDYLKTLSF